MVPDPAFAELDLGSGGTPGRPVPRPPPGTPETRWSALQRRQAVRGTFVNRAAQLVSMAQPHAPPVPLRSYYTDYASMDAAQTAWYLHWRGRTRAGETVPTDLSYLFLHAYEMIHGVGYPAPEEAFSALHDLWSRYRAVQPALDRYLPTWLTDFVQYYGVESVAARSWLAQAGAYASGDQRLQHWIEREDHVHVPDDVFHLLVDYRPEQNKFYRSQPEPAWIDDALRRAVLLTDAYFLETTGLSAFERFSPDAAAPLTRVAFQGVRFDGEPATITAAHVRPYAQDGRLTALMTLAVRFTENLARRHAGVSALLRDADVTLDLAEHLRRHLFPGLSVAIEAVPAAPTARSRRAAAPPNTTPPPAPPPAAPRTLRLDPERLAALQRDSEAIRARLLEASDRGEASDEGEASDTVPARAPTPPLPDPQPAPGPPSTPALLTDLDVVTELLDTISGSARAALLQLRAAGWSLAMDALSAPPGSFVSVLIDDINEAAQLTLGDVLLTEESGVLVTAPDYRDELEVLLGALETAPAAVLHAAATLSDTWHALGERTTPLQRHILTSMLGTPLSVRALGELCAAERAFPDATLEDLNAAALDTIGDLLIDPYHDPLRLDDAYHLDIRRMLQTYPPSRSTP
ncbi:TerB N-terminal domain-containing protein [Deinococcus yunweiensis]|uniref:TerB N-terminal domain-containing protein n=1 Tax=Deinococcus yunweiensis TaxID=367282 RepID=UPI00398EE68C